jgi:hypothetical protein
MYVDIKNPIEKFGLVHPAVYPNFKKIVKNKKKNRWAEVWWVADQTAST